jgi:ABC-type nitrate/sulfonate/bicarbonate transport system permease component
VRQRWPGFALIAVLLGLWEVASRSAWVDPLTVPPVSAIFESWWDSLVSGQLWEAVGPTLRRLATGLALAVVVGIGVGLLMGTIPMAYRLLEPLTEFIRPIPSSAYIPVAILFLGLDDGMKVTVIFLACLFPVLLNTYAGVRAVDKVLVDTGRTFGVLGLKAVRQIVLPAATPSIMTGVRVSLGISLIVAVIAEMLAGGSGIGYLILDSQRTFQVAQVFAGIFTLGVLGYALNAAFLRLEQRLLRWR